MLNHPNSNSLRSNSSTPSAAATATHQQQQQQQLNFKPTRLSQNQRRATDQHTLSHLLGFTLPPRSAQSSQSPSSARRPARRHHAHNTYYDKDQFVHAKYRFILKPTGDYTVYFADPDIRFNWPDILQVIVNLSTSLPTISAHPQTADSDSHASSEKHACPICLSEPTAGRMTKCGHIFCYPCILHYLELSDDGKAQGRKCPVCWETVLKKDLKSVKWFDCSTEAVRDTTGSLSDLMSFRLIERPNFTTLALPRSSTWLSSAVPTHHSPWQFTPDALTFAKFMIAAPDYMMAELNSNLEELHNELLLLSKWSTSQDESQDLGMVFIRAAEVKVREQMEKVALLKTNFVMTEKKKALGKIDKAIKELNRDQDLSAQLQLCTTTDEDELTPTPATVESMISDDQPAYLPNQVEHTLPSSPAATNSHQVDELEVSSEPRLLKSDFLSPPVPKTRKNVNPPEPTSTTYRFYQAASGEQIYLSALDIRVLLAKFGSFDSFPSSITLKVEGWSEVRVSDDLRRRCRYLSHLPTGSEVRMVEVDLDEYLGDDCSLVEAVRKRRAKRKEKTKKEDKAKTKSEMVDQSSWNSFATNSVPDWVAPLDPKDDPIRQDHPSLGAVPGSNDLTRGSVRLIESDVQPSGSRTVWGTYLRPNATSSSSPADEEHDQDDNDVWAKHEHRLGINRNRAGGQRAELNTEDLDDSDDDNQEAGAEGGKKKVGGAVAGPRKKGKQKNRKHVNKVVINLSGGTGGRRF
ncbi:hypothetical protein MJO29_000003 [Puccinia striiformis f. sp. tritici]|uniref:RING-type domain-containing protein n=1 Tax=Puccinia striiformis f. sp. tritici PST-78 TaxID=1165861 RepID=A0A0L0UZW9_9BASI|nr:hypothetical protein Pst134EA_000003 [Puccinia striiformis f. sp. tritici]KAH9472917.1 hypothetical protein Pst134EA_000003 [Puccinia striiformis f. sp. tritici]KAI7966726.1 hypothetical protein MJO29_000003 [Puccinia striiformis f. sp. tritici]KNE92456.1 hypothetical protein PSTG_14177 [Puccinia striiformis f. sp. tritici PST-78]